MHFISSVRPYLIPLSRGAVTQIFIHFCHGWDCSLTLTVSRATMLNPPVFGFCTASATFLPSPNVHCSNPNDEAFGVLLNGCHPFLGSSLKCSSFEGQKQKQQRMISCTSVQSLTIISGSAVDTTDNLRGIPSSGPLKRGVACVRAGIPARE